MLRTTFLMVAMLVLACGDDERRDEPAPKLEPPPPAPIPEGMVRIQAADPVPGFDVFDGDWWEENRWAFDWLESEGWAFFGWKLEASGAGTASVRWWDPRKSGQEFATISCELKEGKPVLLLYGLRHELKVLSPLHLKCAGCGNAFRMSGSISGDPVDCRECGAKVPTDEEWSNAAGREFRVFVFGDGVRASGSKQLKSRGPLLRMGGEPAFKFFVGEVPVSSMMDPTANFCDPIRIQGRGNVDCGSTTHTFSRRYEIDPESGSGSSHSVSSHNDNVEFTSAGGDTTISGTNTEYVVMVNGELVKTDDYPRAVWEFELTWKPE